MVTTHPVDVEEVNLDALSTEDLLRELRDVKVNIASIDAQLKDHTLRPPAPEDDSPAWDAYRDWRRRARWALVHRKEELQAIKQLLTERQDTGMASRRLQVADGTAPSNVAISEERYALLKERLAEQTTETMLLWSWRIVRHLLADHVNTLPASLNETDREHLVSIGIYIRQTYGGRFKLFCDSPDGSLPA